MEDLSLSLGERAARLSPEEAWHASLIYRSITREGVDVFMLSASREETIERARQLKNKLASSYMDDESAIIAGYDLDLLERGLVVDIKTERGPIGDFQKTACEHYLKASQLLPAELTRISAPDASSSEA